MSVNPITASSQLVYNNGNGINVSLPTLPQTYSVAIAGENYTLETMAVTTTLTAIPVANLSNLGLAVFINLDPTNYIEIYNSTSGTAIMKLLPGDPPFLFRFDPAITAPAAKAHTATCLMQYMILEN